MSSLNTSDDRDNLADLVNRVSYAKDRARITRHGKAVAAVVPIEDLVLTERIEDETNLREAQQVLDEAGARFPGRTLGRAA